MEKFSVIQFKIDLTSKADDAAVEANKKVWKTNLSRSAALSLRDALNDKHALSTKDVLISYAVLPA